MGTKLALPIAYLAAVAVATLLLVVAAIMMPITIPRTPLSMTWSQVYALNFIVVLIAGFPGFVLTRSIIWVMSTRSAVSFFLAGAVTGWVAVSVLHWPDYSWEMLQNNAFVVATTIGIFSAWMYRWVERSIAGRESWIEGRGKWRLAGASE
jgi:hypothetical protein